MPMPDPQVEVTTSSNSAGLVSALRYFVSLGLTWAAAKGYIPLDQVGEIGGQIVAILIAGYGIWKTTRRQSDLIVSARAAPNEVATVSPGLK